MHNTVATHGHHQIALADVPSGHEVVGMGRIAGPPVMKASMVNPSSSIRRRTSGHALPQVRRGSRDSRSRAPEPCWGVDAERMKVRAQRRGLMWGLETNRRDVV